VTRQQRGFGGDTSCIRCISHKTVTVHFAEDLRAYLHSDGFMWPLFKGRRVHPLLWLVLAVLAHVLLFCKQHSSTEGPAVRTGSGRWHTQAAWISYRTHCFRACGLLVAFKTSLWMSWPEAQQPSYCIATGLGQGWVGYGPELATLASA